MMQNILAGAALGSIITALIGLAWHRAAVANLVQAASDWIQAADDLAELLEDEHGDRDYWFTMHGALENRLNRIIDQFKNGKSGTAKLAVKIARGEVA